MIHYQIVYYYLTLQSWAPAGIFPGGGANLWGGPKKICEGGPPYFFRQTLEYAYRGGGVVLLPAEFFSRGPGEYFDQILS